MVPFALRMGWDSVTGFAAVMLPPGFGFASAMFNPFTLGTAQRLADLPLFSGLSLRIPLFLITVVVATLYLVRYVRKIEKTRHPAQPKPLTNRSGLSWLPKKPQKNSPILLG
jgi:uncharacterized ion transporter superfamily protein YfcC